MDIENRCIFCNNEALVHTRDREDSLVFSIECKKCGQYHTSKKFFDYIRKVTDYSNYKNIQGTQRELKFISNYLDEYFEHKKAKQKDNLDDLFIIDLNNILSLSHNIKKYVAEKTSWTMG